RGSPLDSAVAAVEADTGLVVDDVLDVNIADDGDVYVVNGGVVEEGVASPIPAYEADAGIAEAVINAAVETNGWAPETFIPDVNSIAPAPVAGGPKKADGRRQHPHARHPVVAVRPPSPVARRPDIARSWTEWLDIHRQRRRGEVHRNEHSREGCGRQGQHHHRD